MARTDLERRGGNNDRDALHVLATVAVHRGNLDDARGYFDRLTQAWPRDAAGHANLGKVRLSLGDARGAVESFERALALQPDLPAALASLADALNRLGERERARDLLLAHVERGENDPEVALQLATVLEQLGVHSRAARIAEQHFDAAQPGKVDPLLRRQLGFTLGRSLDALGECERAFDAFTRANAIAVPGARFNPDEFVQSIDEQIAFFTPQRLRAIMRSRERSPLPVLVTGVARSGTTLVEQIIHAHPQAFGAGELPLLDQLTDSIQSQLDSPLLYPHCLMDLRTDTANALASQHLRQLQGLIPCSPPTATIKPQRIVDKSLRAVMHLGLIWTLLPGATVIHCRRDPLANGLSCFMSALSPIKHSWASDLGHIGLVIRETDRLMDHWRKTLDLPMLDVQFEEMVADPQRVSRAIIAHIDLEWDDRCLRYHESDRVVRTLSYDQVRRPIYAAAVDRHRRYEKFLSPLRKSLERSATR